VTEVASRGHLYCRAQNDSLLSDGTVFRELTSLVAIIRGQWIIIYYYVSPRGLSAWSRSQEGCY